MANLLGQVPASRPIRRGPRHHRLPPEISSYEETIIIDSVFPVEETIDFVRRGPRHHSSREITAAMSSPVRRGPRGHPREALGPPIPLSGYYYFTYFGHHHDFMMPLHQEDANYYYPAMPSTSGIYNNERGQELSSNLHWARVEEDEETMILNGGIEYDDGVLMSGPLSHEIITSCLKTRNPCPEDEQEDKMCAICLDDFGQESDKMIGVLDCRHEYHAGCITKWLTNKNFCPLCKAVAL